MSSSIEPTGFTELPVLDLGPILPGSTSTPEERQALALELQAACVDVGFFLARAFFSLPSDEKRLIDIKHAASFQGYVGMREEKNGADSKGDLHEGFNLGQEAGSVAGPKAANQWPDEGKVPGFRAALTEGWDNIVGLGRRLFPLLALALNLEEDHFTPQLTNPGSAMRVLRYPAQSPTSVDLREIGIGAHTDYQMLTLLKTDEVEALQVLNGSGEWVQVPSLPGHIVVNLGNSMERLTNGLFKSTVHRVINTTGRERFSIPFFFGLDYDASLEVLPGCTTAERPAHWPPITAGEYVKSQLEATYPTSGTQAGAAGEEKGVVDRVAA